MIFVACFKHLGWKTVGFWGDWPVVTMEDSGIFHGDFFQNDGWGVTFDWVAPSGPMVVISIAADGILFTGAFLHPSL